MSKWIFFVRIGVRPIFKKIKIPVNITIGWFYTLPEYQKNKRFIIMEDFEDDDYENF